MGRMTIHISWGAPASYDWEWKQWCLLAFLILLPCKWCIPILNAFGKQMSHHERCKSICCEQGKTTIPQSYCKGIALVCRVGSSTFYQLYPTVNLLPFPTAPLPSDKLTAIRFTGLLIGNTRLRRLQQSCRKLHSMKLLFVPSLSCALRESTYTLVWEPINHCWTIRRCFQGQGGSCFCTAWQLCPLLQTPISALRLHPSHPPHGQAFSCPNSEVKPFFLTSIKRLNTLF